MLNFYFLNEYRQIGNAKNVIIDEIIYIGAYPVLGDTNKPSNAGPKPIVASQKMKNVERAYERLCSGVFLVIIAVQAEFRVPNPNAAQTAHIMTVTFDGTNAISIKPIDCATIPTTQTILSPPLSWILPASGLVSTRQTEYIMKNHEKTVVRLTSTAYSL